MDPECSWPLSLIHLSASSVLTWSSLFPWLFWMTSCDKLKVVSLVTKAVSGSLNYNGSSQFQFSIPSNNQEFKFILMSYNYYKSSCTLETQWLLQSPHQEDSSENTDLKQNNTKECTLFMDNNGYNIWLLFYHFLANINGIYKIYENIYFHKGRVIKTYL